MSGFWFGNKLHAVDFIFLAMLVGLLAACNKPAENTAPAAMPPMPVSVLAVQATSVPMQVEAVAQTEGASEVEVRPRVGGIILKKLFEEGQPVKAGQVMFQLDPVPFQIALMQAKAKLVGQDMRMEQTDRESDRLKKLLASQSISQREYDNATSDASVSKAEMMQAQAGIKEAELNLSYTKVTAPSSGIAGRFLYSEGALAALANTSLLTTIVQASPIWVRFSLSESELQILGGQANTSNLQEVSLILANDQEYAQKGKINFADNKINPSLGTQELRATFENADKQLMPGQFLRARVTTGTREGVFLVPQSAILTGEQGKFVYVVNAKNEATIKPVKVAEWQGGNWIVLEGLNVNDKVIVDNLIKLQPGAAVKPMPLGAASSLPAGAPAK